MHDHQDCGGDAHRAFESLEAAMNAMPVVRGDDVMAPQSLLDALERLRQTLRLPVPAPSVR
ncbi:MAG: hypothetical protein KA712_19690 [Myxococcales bacterium]|nr:hypothetical protein [Myxococcales bacterium]